MIATKALASALIAAATVTMAASAAADPSRCVAISGTFEPQCNGVICNQGRVTGDLSGTFSSRVTSQYPAGGAWQFTGWTRIVLDGRRGVVETLDAGVAPRDAKGGPDYANPPETLKLADARGQFEEFDGSVRIDPGRAVGKTVRYEGRFCPRG